MKKERVNGELKEQNTLTVEAKVIQQLAELNFSIPLPKICFISENPEMFGYTYIEGDLLIEVWKNLSKKERIKICQDLGVFHAELGQKITEEIAKKWAWKSTFIQDCTPKLNRNTTRS